MLSIRAACVAVSLILGLAAGCGAPAASPAPSGTQAASAQTAAAGKAPQNLTFGYEVISATQVPSWVVADAGYGAKNGLNVKAILMGTADKSAAALLSGTVDMAYLETIAVINADASGGDLVVVGDSLSTFPEWMYGSRGITSVDQLRGKKVGAPSLGSAGDLLMRCYLQRQGLNPKKDVVYTAIGGQPQVVAALEAGAVSAGVLVPPFTIRADNAGLKSLAFVGGSGCPKLMPEIVTTRKFLKAHPDMVADFLKAHMQAEKRIESDKTFAVQEMLKYIHINQTLASQAYDKILPYWAKPGQPVLNDTEIQKIRDLAAQVMNPAVKSLKPSAVLDYSVYKQVIASGFVNTLK